MCSVHQTAAEDTETPTAKVIFLDAAGRVAEARSGNVSGIWISGLLGELRYDFDVNLSYSPFSSSVVCAHHGRREDILLFLTSAEIRNGNATYVYERTTRRLTAHAISS